MKMLLRFAPGWGDALKKRDAQPVASQHRSEDAPCVRTSSTLRRRARIAVGGPSALSQRVVVKAHYVKMNTYGAKAAWMHVRYIERDGVERDGSPGVLYDSDGLARREDFEAARDGEKNQFRLIVSPENAGDLDMTLYVRRVMAQVEKDLGRRLEWAAVNDHDTEHPHAHVIVRGVDRDGRELRIDRDYIRQGLRWRAQELRPRSSGRGSRPTSSAHARARSSKTGSRRSTASSNAAPSTASCASPRPRGALRRSRIRVLIARLEHLERLQLVDRVSRTSWSLRPGWNEDLRALGGRGDVIKQMHRAVRGDTARYRDLRAGEPLQQPVVGRLAAKQLRDELRGDFVAIVETANGGALRFPLSAKDAERLQQGAESSPSELPAPGHRIAVSSHPLRLDAQVGCRGPVWLDGVDRGPLAPYGFRRGGRPRLPAA